MQTGFLSEYCKIELYGRKCQRTEITETKNPDESPGFPVISKWIKLPYTILSRFLNTSDIIS